MEFLEDNASALFALAGAFGGACLTFLSGWLLRKREYNLRLWESLMERPIQAHERLLEVASEMRIMVTLGTFDAGGELLRVPEVLLSRNIFEAWFEGVARGALQRSTWISPPAKREANFLQDYLATLHATLKPIADEDFCTVGAMIRQDFSRLSAELERSAFAFFHRDVRRLKLPDLSEWYKYRKEETGQRLRDTDLVKRWSEINRLARDHGSS